MSETVPPKTPTARAELSPLDVVADMQFWMGAREKGQWAETSEEDISQAVRGFLGTGPSARRRGDIGITQVTHKDNTEPSFYD